MDTVERLPVRQGEKWGFQDGDGRVVIEAQFEGVGSFSEGLARVKTGGKWGFIDGLGKMVIEARFEQARIFIEGQAKVKLDGRWMMIDKQGASVEELDAQSFLGKDGEFISEQEYKDWGKPPRSRDRDL